MSKSSSYKQGPSLVARQSKGYSGDRSHTASGYPHLPAPRQGRATPRRSRGRAPRAGRRTPAPASASSPRRSGPTATCTTTTQPTRSVGACFQMLLISMYIAVTQSATSPHARVPAVSAAVGADPERGAAADRGQGPPHRGQPAPRRPAAGGQVRRHWWRRSRYSALIGRQGAQHLVLAAGARRGAGQKQERDKPHDEDKVLEGLGYSTLI